ncbi:MAG: PAS domain S-box protein [Bacteroidetes bacterium]|nr:PAS domain S-box protein [Bacteroidota bacterium]
MEKKISILHLEDQEEDSVLVKALISKGFSSFDYYFAEDEKDFIEALQEKKIDVILSDYQLPDYSGEEALVFAKNYCPHIPFIFVTGKMGEDTAIESLLNGATDYVLKSKMGRLVPAIKRALHETGLLQERIDSDKALYESEKKFRAIFEKNSSALAIIEPDTTVSMVNEAFCQMSGYSEQQAVGKSWTLLIVPEDLERLKEYNRRRLINPNDAPGKYEFSFFHKNGEKKQALMSLVMIQDNRKILTSFTDITERKQAEDKLRETDCRLREVLENSQSVSYKRNLQTNDYDYLSPVFVKISGYTMEEIQPLPMEGFINFIHPDDVAEMKRMMALSISSSAGDAYQMEYRFKHKNGQYRWCQDQFTVMRNEGGQPTAIIGSVSEINERKQAEIMLQDIIDKNPMSIQIVDKDGFTLNVNPAHTLLFGSVPPSDFSIFTDLQNKQPALEKLFLLAKSGQVVHLPDIYYNVHDSLPESPDVPLWIRAVIFPLKDKDGKPERFVLMHENITERKLAEEKLKESEERYRILSEQSPIAIELYNAEGLLVSVNPACLELFGITDTNEISRFSLFDDPNISDEYKNDLMHGKNVHYQVAFDFEKVRELNLYHTTKSGHIWLDVLITLIKDDGKAPNGYLLHIQDITERIRNQEDIYRTNKLLDSIVENIPNIIFLKEANALRFVRVNKAGEELLGIPKEEMLGKNDYDFFSKGQGDYFIEKDKEVLLRKVMVDIPEEPIQTRHQGIRILHTRKVPILNTLGEPEYLLGISEDITRKRQTEIELLKLNEELEQRVKLLTAELEEARSGN